MDRKDAKRRLERAGFRHVAGWLRAEDAERVGALIRDCAEAAEAALQAPQRPAGRPKREA